MTGEASMIPMTIPLIGDEEAAAAAAVLRSGWVTQGPRVAAFEGAFATYVGARYACAVSSCTTALHLALLVLGVRPGDEVITASHSFIATANSIRYCGALPVFVDVQPDTFNLDPARVEAVVTERTRAILAVHQMGMPCDLTALLEISRRRGVPLIEDAACAVGSEVRLGGAWERVGKPHGDIACFSFHPRKLVTTGDGGMLTTDNAEWDNRFRRWRQHSMSVADSTRHGAATVIFESYPELGYNYRMTDIQAAIGIEQLKRLPEVVTRRRLLAERYRLVFADIPGVVLPREPEWAKSNWQSFCVRLPARFDQRRVMQTLLDAGVASRRGIMCAHREAAYPTGTWSCGVAAQQCGCPPGSCERLRESEAAQDRTILVPLFPQMTFEQQDRVAAALRAAVEC
jgi:dTDP-4-amino-4,6-dideoxygalactose transaminase